MLRRSLYLILLLSISQPALRSGASAPTGAKAKAEQAVARGLAYLRGTQESDGSWSHYPAITALALAGFLRNGRTGANDSAVAKGLRFLVRSAHPNGSIYSAANPATALPNYNTSLAVVALTLTHNALYSGLIHKAQLYLERSQIDESHGVSPSDPRYGGIGYGDDPGDIDNPDLSNLQMALEALKDSGAPASAPVWNKAIIFLQRVQNREQSNDQAWAKQAGNDGGFVYDSRGRSNTPDGGHTSYGAMTYAGLESYIYCGVSRQDPRAMAAYHWIRGNYTVRQHPKMGTTSLYYYYHTFAKTLDVYGAKIVRDLKGKPHNWSMDLAVRLEALQHPDGSWSNTNARYWENQPNLVTSYSLISLSYCIKQLT
ncbi:MAG TPA: prenyltransferase/squalene oxidase repeat-containing protein [Chthonomonadales bacterium]|nr:prenyltransferase/squalene oxidase repeat-containing protein [Chthonomonadales bacterium]